MKIAIVGTRTGRADIELRVREYVRKVATTTPDLTIISGGAIGPDQWAIDEADKIGLAVEIIRPDWTRYGRSAGMIRNGEIVERADLVVAFWNGSSRGTKNTIERAKRAGAKCVVIDYY